MRNEGWRHADDIDLRTVFSESFSALPPEEGEVTLVDLNTAEAEELATLPGIGEGLAKRIVDYRTEHGPFEGPEGLLEVSGIGQAKAERFGVAFLKELEHYEQTHGRNAP